MAQPTPIRIGMIGAGSICRTRHVPGLKALDNVQLVAVSNRSRESSQKAAKEFGFDAIETDWRKLVERSDIDAVFIGTWPYTHMEMSLAALEAGKHVFCQARMAMDLDEARQMVRAAHEHPDLVNMVCPPPTRMPFEDLIRELVSSGELGELSGVQIQSVSAGALQSDTLHWRENVAYSGKQIMAVGIYAETLNALLGEYEHLSAQFGQVIHHKQDSQGKQVEVKIPQVVAIHGRLAGGIVASEFHCGVAAGERTPDALAIFGTKATLRHTFMSSTLELARGGRKPEPVKIPKGQPREVDEAWTVERDFIEAVRAAQRGESWNVSPDFAEALLYMKKLEAVHLSASTGQRVKLSEL